MNIYPDLIGVFLTTMAGPAIQERDVGQNILPSVVDATPAGSGRPKREGSIDLIRTPDFPNALTTNLGKLSIGLLENGNLPFENQRIMLPVMNGFDQNGRFQLSSAIVSFDGRDPLIREEYEIAREDYRLAQEENVTIRRKIKELSKGSWSGGPRSNKENRARLERLIFLYEVINETQALQVKAAENLSHTLFGGDLDIFTRPLTPENLGILVNQGKFSKYEGPLDTIQKHFERNHPSGGSKPPEPPDEGDGSERPAWGLSTHLVQYAAVGGGVVLVVGGVAIECATAPTPTAYASFPDEDVGDGPPLNEPTPTATVDPTEVPVFQPTVVVDGVSMKWSKKPEVELSLDAAYQLMKNYLVNPNYTIPFGSSLASRASYFVIDQEKLDSGEQLQLEMYAQKVEGLKDEVERSRDNIYLISTPIGKDTNGNVQWKYQLAKWVPTADHQGNGGFEEYQLVYIGADLKETADRFFFVSRNPGEKNFILSFNGHSEGNLGPIEWQAGDSVDIAGFFDHLLGRDGFASPQVVAAKKRTATFTPTHTPTPSKTLTPTEILTATIQAINTEKATNTATLTAPNTPTKVPVTKTAKPKPPAAEPTETSVPVTQAELMDQRIQSVGGALGILDAEGIIKPGAVEYVTDPASGAMIAIIQDAGGIDNPFGFSPGNVQIIKAGLQKMIEWDTAVNSSTLFDANNYRVFVIYQGVGGANNTAEPSYLAPGVDAKKLNFYLRKDPTRIGAVNIKEGALTDAELNNNKGRPELFTVLAFVHELRGRHKPFLETDLIPGVDDDKLDQIVALEQRIWFEKRKDVIPDRDREVMQKLFIGG